MQAIYISEMPVVRADMDSAVAHILLIDVLPDPVLFWPGDEQIRISYHKATFIFLLNTSAYISEVSLHIYTIFSLDILLSQHTFQEVH